MAWVRRALLIQTIAIGIERIEAADPLVSRDPTMNAVDHIYSPHHEIDGTRRFEQVRERR